ncbi:MAG: hypothetical protein ABIK98_04485 [Pseudomonadota bacterium]
MNEPNMGPNKDSLQALDAVISGYAYENATVAIGVLEEGQNTKRWVSTEMLCTLDNFIKTVLFNERIFLTGCSDIKDNYFVPRDAEYMANEAGQRLFDEAKIFFPIKKIEGDSNAVEERVTQTLHPVNTQKYPLLVIQCEFPKKKLTIHQEMVYLDAYFIEYAIEQFGTERFKPVFPGEHLYLGLRRERVTISQATHTMADIPGRRLRAIVRERMKKLNVFVTQGAPMLPELPPMFVSRILHDCTKGSDFVPTLLKVRNSPAMRSFRKWLVRCWDLSRETDMDKRQKAADAFEKLNQFSPEDDLSATEFGINLLKIAKDVATADPVGIVTEIASPIVKYLGGIPFSGLRQFGGKNADPERLKKFFKDNFGDQFNRNDMDFVSTLIKLPDNLTDWGNEEATFTAYGGRLDSGAPPLARPCFTQVKDAAYINNAQKDFDDLFNRGSDF